MFEEMFDKPPSIDSASQVNLDFFQIWKFNDLFSLIQRQTLANLFCCLSSHVHICNRIQVSMFRRGSLRLSPLHSSRRSGHQSHCRRHGHHLRFRLEPSEWSAGTAGNSFCLGFLKAGVSIELSLEFELSFYFSETKVKSKCLFLGASPLSSNWADENGESVPTNHSQHLREGDVREGSAFSSSSHALPHPFTFF